VRRPLRFCLIAFALVLAAGCDDATGPHLDSLTPEIADRIAGPVAFLAFAVASGSEGHSFLDNFLPTPRRGVIHYVDTPIGRSATFYGCDLGGGIVLEGRGELVWVGPDLAPERDRFCSYAGDCLSAFRWTGRLTLTLDGEKTVAVDEFSVTDLATVTPFGELPHPVSATVAVAGSTVPVDDPDLYQGIFDATGIDPGSLPNPSGSLDALTSPDMHRLAYHAGLYLAYLLLNEMSEVLADHTHEMPCGTTTVTFDQDRFAHVACSWSDCPLQGIFYGGEFNMEFDPAGTDFGAPRLTMDLTGDLTLGGGVPSVRLSAWQWRAEFPQEFPGAMKVSMVLDGYAGDRRTFSETVLVDD